MKTEHIHVLKEFGLSDHEAKVYFASLSLGPTTILKIAKNADIRRTTVYSVVESLKKKGLLSIESGGFKNIFTAENPERLKNILELKQKSLESTLPEFTQMFNMRGEEGVFKYYEGIESIKQIYNELLKDFKPHEEYCAVTDHGKWFDIDPKFFMDYIERRSKLPINIRLLFEENARGKEHKKIERNFNETVRILPTGHTLDTNLVITPGKIMMHTLSLPYVAVVLTNRNFIKMQKEFFEVMWKSSENKN